MSLKVEFNYLNESKKFNVSDYQKRVTEINEQIENRTLPGGDFLGWLHYSSNFDSAELDRINKKAKEFRDNYELLVVCGIGGSYLGAKAVIEAINGIFPSKQMQIIYLGNTLDPNYINESLEYIKNKKFCVCVVSKSGTTTETSVSFRLLKLLAEEKYGKVGASKAIVAITDKEKGALRKLATIEGYETFALPADMGGRFSVMSPVGLFPIACAGIDIKEFQEGFKLGEKLYGDSDLNKNEAYKYACERHFLYEAGYKVELFADYEPRLSNVNEWLKQLFDESEGKDGKSLFSTSCVFTTDLHSLGQFIQEGSKILFETVLFIEKPNKDVVVPEDKDDLDGLNYLAGKKLSFVNREAYLGTLDAHANTGNVPNITITLDHFDTKMLGQLLYFFMKTTAMSGYLNGVNPFNQPGVEVYKKNMFHLLGKKGY